MILLIGLTHNIALLFALTFVYSLIAPRTNQLSPVTRTILQGAAFGFFGILAMASGILVGNGFIIDGRMVILAIATAFAGWIPALIAAVSMLLYRMLLAGAGLAPSFPVILGTVLVSFLFFYGQERFKSPHVVRFLLLGIVNALLGITWIRLLGGPQSAQVLTQVALPLLIFIPLGTVLLGFLLFYQQQQFDMSTALRESEERYRVVVQSMDEGIILQNAKGEIQAANPAADNIMGLTAAQIVGSVPFDANWQAIDTNGAAFLRENFPSQVALRSGKPQPNVSMGIYKPGMTLTWITVHAQPLFTKGSKTPYGALTTFSEITTIRKAQEKLRQERDLLRTLIDNTPDYIFLKDADGRFILTNTAHSYAAGNIEPDELTGKTAFDVFSPDLAKQFHEDDMRIMKSGQALINAERETVDAQGNRKNVLTTKIPWRDEHGQILGLVGISRDVTERKQLESQTIILAAEKERVRVLQRFIADMSHDFRTPLSVINSSTYLLRRLVDPDKREEKLKNIEYQSDRMLKLLDDLLEMGRLDEKGLQFHFTKEMMNSVVETIVSNFEVMATNKGQTLEFIPDTSLPAISLDMLKFSRALINLVQNAINYTPNDGKITLRTGIEGDNVTLSIADNGIGIAEDDLPHIFERFYRADLSRTTSTGGSGLGLPITKRIIEAHNGTISVESVFGKGTTFLIKLPLAARESEKTV